MSNELYANDIWECLKPALISGAKAGIISALNNDPPLIIIGNTASTASAEFVTRVVRHPGQKPPLMLTRKQLSYLQNTVLIKEMKTQSAIRMARAEINSPLAVTPENKLEDLARVKRITRIAGGGVSPRRQEILDTMISRIARAVINDTQARQTHTHTHGAEETAALRNKMVKNTPRLQIKTLKAK